MTYGLSNTVYLEPATWPKIKKGKQLLEETIRDAAEKDLGEEELMDQLFALLEDDTMPNVPPEQGMDVLRETIFVPAFANDQGWRDMTDAAEQGRGQAPFDEISDESDPETELPKDPPINFMKGAYGTQRQTLILIDWDGNVTYKERAIWDAHGRLLDKGKEDVVIRYKIGEVDQ
jgi:uncharacterized protein with NRDE domain